MFWGLLGLIGTIVFGLIGVYQGMKNKKPSETYEKLSEAYEKLNKSYKELRENHERLEQSISTLPQSLKDEMQKGKEPDYEELGRKSEAYIEKIKKNGLLSGTKESYGELIGDNGLIPNMYKIFKKTR